MNHHRWPGGIPADEQEKYLDFVHEQLHELLTKYGPIAAISFNGLQRVKRLFPDWTPQDLYDQVHGSQPTTLVAFRQGHTGTEDFCTVNELLPSVPQSQRRHRKPMEIRQSLTPGGRGFNACEAGHHLKVEALLKKMGYAYQNGANLLVNTALMPDGSLDLEDITTLLDFGKQLPGNR